MSFWRFFPLLLLLATPLARGETSPQVRPTTQTKSCTENGCHAEITDYPVLHGPLEAGSCAGCHAYQDVSRHTFKMTRQGNDLCLFCHQIEKGANSHKPLNEKGCLECHNPHGGATKTHLREKTVRAQCEQCHEGTIKGKLAHEPISTGGCLACHNPHRSDYPKLLRQETTAVCLGCHVVFADRVEKLPNVHEPMNKGCLECHDAHASDSPKLLKSPMLELCFSCHEDIKMTVERALTPHGALEEIGECMNCHDPHAAGQTHLLRDTTEKLCLKCHDREIQTPSGKIPDMTHVLATGNSLHGPLTINDCTVCHQIHGGVRPRLLVKQYPSSFYSPFREKSYELCFSCHDPSLAMVPRTTSLTGFRDGDKNLHYVHVNQKEKGRTCRACHEIHAGESPKLIRKTAYFGNYKIPVNFSMTATGGTCSPGCHDSASYNRQIPANTQPSTDPPGQPDKNGEKE